MESTNPTFAPPSKALLAIACVALTVAARGQTSGSGLGTYSYVASGRSFLLLGSEDTRLGLELGTTRVYRERWFRQLGRYAYAVENFDLLGSVGQDGRYDPAATIAVGAMYGFRFISPSGWFLEGSEGLQLQNRESHDLASWLNSTPTATFGKYIDADKSRYLGLRIMHISNAGTKHHNRGQNYFMLTYGIRF